SRNWSSDVCSSDLPPNEPGRWRMVAVINPGRQQHRRIKVGDTIQRIPVGMKLVPVDDLPQQASWFARRLASGRTHEPLRPVDEVATINTWRVVSAATRRSRHRKGHLDRKSTRLNSSHVKTSYAV